MSIFSSHLLLFPGLLAAGAEILDCDSVSNAMCVVGVASTESTETLTNLDDTLLETPEKTQEMRNRLWNWFELIGLTSDLSAQ